MAAVCHFQQEFEAFREHWSDKCGYHCGCGHTNMGASSSTLGKETDLDSRMTDVDGRVEDEEIMLCKVISVDVLELITLQI